MPNKELKEIEGAIEGLVISRETYRKGTTSYKDIVIALSCMELVKEIIGNRSKKCVVKKEGENIEVYPSIRICYLQSRYQQIRRGK